MSDDIVAILPYTQGGITEMSFKPRLNMLKLMQTQGSQERQKIGKGNPKMYISRSIIHPKLNKIKTHYGKISRFTQKLRSPYIFEILLDM